MNKSRRQEIERAMTMLDEAKGILEACRDEEQDYFDNMPESFQSGDKGQAAENAVALLEDIISNLDDAISQAGEITA